MTDHATPATTDDASPIRPAATVLLLRSPADNETDGHESADRGHGDPRGPAGTGRGLEVLMVRRHARSGFAASAWVFPGGTVDEADRTLPANAWTGIDPDALAARFDLRPQDTLGMYAAAVREAFEEAGVLLARHGDGRPADVPAEELAAMRTALNDRTATADWVGFLRRHDLVLDLSAMTYWLRWVTPIQEPRRYDTCFFLAVCPPGARPEADSIETTEARWVAPSAALADSSFSMIFPTQRTMEWMAGHDSVDSLIAAARDLPSIPPLQPHILVDADGRYTGILMPSDDDYPHAEYA